MADPGGGAGGAGDLLPAEHDEGRVSDVDDQAHSGLMVHWDSGVSTPLPDGSSLRVGERPVEWSERIAAELRDDG